MLSSDICASSYSFVTTWSLPPVCVGTQISFHNAIGTFVQLAENLSGKQVVNGLWLAGKAGCDLQGAFYERQAVICEGYIKKGIHGYPHPLLLPERPYWLHL